MLHLIAFISLWIASDCTTSSPRTTDRNGGTTSRDTTSSTRDASTSSPDTTSTSNINVCAYWDTMNLVSCATTNICDHGYTCTTYSDPFGNDPCSYCQPDPTSTNTPTSTDPSSTQSVTESTRGSTTTKSTDTTRTTTGTASTSQTSQTHFTDTPTTTKHGTTTTTTTTTTSHDTTRTRDTSTTSIQTTKSTDPSSTYTSTRDPSSTSSTSPWTSSSRTTDTGECCDPSTSPSAMGNICFEGETCCPNGDWVCNNGGVDVNLGITATCDGEIISERANPCHSSTESPTSTKDDGDCCTYKDYVWYVNHYPQSFGGYACCPDGTWTLANDATNDVSVGITMWCGGEEIPVRWGYHYMCPTTYAPTTTSTTDSTRTMTTRSTEATTTRSVTKSTETSSTKATTTKVMTTDDGLCCDRRDLYTWYGSHGANYCHRGMACCPDGTWTCVDDEYDADLGETMTCGDDKEVMRVRMGYYHECDTTTDTPWSTKSTWTSTTETTETTPIWSTKSTETTRRNTDTSSTKTSDDTSTSSPDTTKSTNTRTTKDPDTTKTTKDSDTTTTTTCCSYREWIATVVSEGYTTESDVKYGCCPDGTWIALTDDRYDSTHGKMRCGDNWWIATRIPEDYTCPCDCYMSRTSASNILGTGCDDDEECVPYDNDDWNYSDVYDKRCGYCSTTTTTTSGSGSTTSTTPSVQNSDGNMEMVMIGIVFVCGIFGWM